MNCLKRAKKEARTERQKAETLAEWYEFCKRADAVILYTLWQDFGFGAKRLERFYRRFLYNSEDMYLRYDNNHSDGEQLDDEGIYHAIDNTPRDQRGRERYAVIRGWLKDAGVDVEEWQKWKIEDIMREEAER